MMFLKGLKIVCEESYSIRAQYSADFPAEIHDVTNAALPTLTKKANLEERYSALYQESIYKTFPQKNLKTNRNY